MTKLDFNYYIHTLLYSKYKFILFLTFYFICIQMHYLDFTPVADCMPTANLGYEAENELSKAYNTVETQANKFEAYREYKAGALQKMYNLAKELHSLRDSPGANTTEGKEILTIYHFIYEHKKLLIENEALQQEITNLNASITRLNEHNTQLQTTLDNLQNQEHQRLLDGVEQGGEHQNEREPHRAWYTLLCVCCEKSYACIQNAPILFTVCIVLAGSLGVNVFHLNC